MKFNAISSGNSPSDGHKKSSLTIYTNSGDDSELLNEKMITTEAEIDLIREELETVQRALKLQTKRCRQLVSEYTKRLQDKEHQYQSERTLRNDQLAKVLRALLIFEARLKQEQKFISHQLEEKDYLINKQRKEISNLMSMNLYCKHCNKFYNLGLETSQNTQISNVSSLDSSSDYVTTDCNYQDYQSSLSLDSSSETYATISEKDFKHDDDNNCQIKNHIYQKNKFNFLKRGRKMGYRKSFGNYFEVIKVKEGQFLDDNYENLNKLDEMDKLDELDKLDETEKLDKLNKLDKLDKFEDLNSKNIDEKINLVSERIEVIFNNNSNYSSNESDCNNTVIDKSVLNQTKISENISPFEGEETNDKWYASGSDQEIEEQRDVYRNNPVLECMNQILLHNINDTNSPPKTPNVERKGINSKSKKVKFSDQEEDKSDYYETPIQKQPNFYETPQSIYSNDYEQIVMKGSQEKEVNILPTKRLSVAKEGNYYDMDTKLDVKLDSELDLRLDSKLDSKLDKKLDSKLDKKLDSKLDKKLDSKLDLRLDSKLDSKLDLRLDSKLDSKLDMKLDTKLGTKLEKKLCTKLEKKFGTKLDTKLDKKLDTKLDSKLESNLIVRKSKILRTPPALPPKPINLVSKYKINLQSSTKSENSTESEPDYCSISELNLPLKISDDFQNINLQNVNLQNPNLQNTILQNANLQNSNLQNTNLQNTNLKFKKDSFKEKINVISEQNPSNILENSKDIIIHKPKNQIESEYDPVDVEIANLVSKNIEKFSIQLAKQTPIKTENLSLNKSIGLKRDKEIEIIPKLPQVSEIIIPEEEGNKDENDLEKNKEKNDVKNDIKIGIKYDSKNEIKNDTKIGIKYDTKNDIKIGIKYDTKNELKNEIKNETKNEIINQDNYIKNNTQILKINNNRRPIIMGSTVSSLITGFNQQLISEIQRKPKIEIQFSNFNNQNLDNLKQNDFPNVSNDFSNISNDFPNISNDFSNISNDFPNISNDTSNETFQTFDLSQNFEEFKLEDCEIEEFNIPSKNDPLDYKTPVVSTQINDNIKVPNLNLNLNVEELSENKSLMDSVYKSNAVIKQDSEPTYEHFLECTGLSTKSILTPSRLLSNHKSVLKPKDVKLRSRVRSTSVFERHGSTIKYWSEPYI